jgi:hypothetical protein
MESTSAPQNRCNLSGDCTKLRYIFTGRFKVPRQKPVRSEPQRVSSQALKLAMPR